MKNKLVAIIDAGGANFTSIQAALMRLGIISEVTSDIGRIQSASHVILPGVGAAGYAMRQLYDKNLVEVIRSLCQPVLGICLGQQLLCKSSEEDNTVCLGIIPIEVKKLKNMRVIPHMGWNNINNINNINILKNISVCDNFYFIHSFAPEVDEAYTLGITEYGSPFSAVIQKDNFYGVQFHPEKSGEVGLQLLANFIEVS